MSKKKKYIVLFLPVVFIGTGLVISLLLQKEPPLKSVDESQQEGASEPDGVVSQSIDPARLDSELHPRNQEIQLSKDLSEKPKKEEIVSAVLSAITRQLPSNKLSEEDFDGLIDVLSDKSASPKDRRQAAWLLAKNGDVEVLLELEKILLQQDVPPYLKAAIAEGFGYSTNPLGKNLILSALEDEEDAVVRGAIRGLSAIGDREAISTLSNILFSNERSNSVIAEAAKGLGTIDQPDAYYALIEAYNDPTISTSTDFKEDIIAALGQRDILETDEFFQKTLNENADNPSLQLATIEAIQDAKGETSPFLLGCLDNENSEIRAEAAWALAVADDPGDISDELQRRLYEEEDAEVKKRLYQALGNQESVDIDAAAEAIFKETDLDTRLAGYDLLASNIDSSENTKVKERFVKEIIPELQEIALSSERLNARLSAVIALKKADTVDSFNALEMIASKSSDMKVVEATEIFK